METFGGAVAGGEEGAFEWGGGGLSLLVVTIEGGFAVQGKSDAFGDDAFGSCCY